MRQVPRPNIVINRSASCTVAYRREQRDGGMPSLTLLPSGHDRSTIILQRPVFNWTALNVPLLSGSGPTIRPAATSSVKYEEIICGFATDDLWLNYDMNNSL